MFGNSFIFNRSQILPYWGWNAYTPVIPKLYWDCESAEQSVKNLWRNFDKLTHYASYIAEQVNSLEYVTPEELEKETDELKEDIYELKNLILEIIGGAGESWNVRKGSFDSSVESMRDMFEMVTVHAYRCDDIAVMNVTVSQVADCGLNCEGWATSNSAYFKNKISDVLPQYKF